MTEEDGMVGVPEEDGEKDCVPEIAAILFNLRTPAMFVEGGV